MHNIILNTNPLRNKLFSNYSIYEKVAHNKKSVTNQENLNIIFKLTLS